MGKRKQGFACLSPEQRTAIARLGGKQCQLLGLGNQFNSETGKLAGHKGGTASSRKPGHMSRLGKLGAESRRLAKLRGQRGLGATGQKQVRGKKDDGRKSPFCEFIRGFGVSPAATTPGDGGNN